MSDKRKLSEKLTAELSALGTEQGFIGWSDGLEECIDAVRALEAERDKWQERYYALKDATFGPRYSAKPGEGMSVKVVEALAAERDELRAEVARLKGEEHANGQAYLQEFARNRDAARQARKEALQECDDILIMLEATVRREAVRRWLRAELAKLA